MERNWSVIRYILERAEKQPLKARHEAFETWYPQTFNREYGADPQFEDLVRYNVRLLLDQKFLEAYTQPADAIGRLFWSGHNLLEELRSNPSGVPQSAFVSLQYPR